MPSNPPRIVRKRGANRNDPAKKAKKRDANFSQSRDIHEDRGARQAKTIFRGRRG